MSFASFGIDEADETVPLKPRIFGKYYKVKSTNTTSFTRINSFFQFFNLKFNIIDKRRESALEFFYPCKNYVSGVGCIISVAIFVRIILIATFHLGGIH